MRSSKILSAVLLVLVGAVCFAEEARPAPRALDLVVLADGRRIEGEVVAQNDKFVSVRVNGVTRAYPRAKVASVKTGVLERPVPDSARTPTDGAKPGKTRRGSTRDPDAPLGQDARSWLDALVARSSRSDPQVLRSIAAALTALGAPAIAPLEEAMAGADDEHRGFLEKVLKGLRKRVAKGAGKAKTTDGSQKGPERADAKKKKGPRGKDRGGRGRLTRLLQALELDDEQRIPVTDVLTQAQKRRHEIVRAARGDGTPETQIATQMEALRKDVVEELRGVLDEGQLEVFHDLAQRMFSVGKPPRKGGKKKAPDGI